MQESEAQIFKFPLDPVDTESSRERNIDIHGLLSFLNLFLGSLVSQCTHVVETVGKLDEDDSDVIRHGHEHLTDIVSLLLDLGIVSDHAELGIDLGNAVNEIGDGGAEELAQELHIGRCVLYRIMKKGPRESLCINIEFSKDLGDRDRVDDVHLPRLSSLIPVCLISKKEGLPQQSQVTVINLNIG